MSEFRYYWTPRLAERNVGSLCPESPERCLILDPVKVFEADNSVAPYSFESRDPAIIQAVHSGKYIDTVRSAFANKKRALDSGDTRVTENIFEQALLSASAGCEALDFILLGRRRRAFCAVRPPGHHANAVRALGFCVFNNAAVAAAYAREKFGLSRVLIIDWDVHPGNGTQEIFWEDPSVFVLSFHEEKHFGDSGLERHIGEGEGHGFNRNVCFREGTANTVYLTTFACLVPEVCAEFKPELIIISAGFDAHRRDLVAKQQLEDEDYARMTEIVLKEAEQYCEGRLLSILEGGYNTSVLRYCVGEHCNVLRS